MINEQLKALAVPIDSLAHDPQNARLHDERNLAAIRHSLQEFGQQKPVVVNRDNVVIAGNGMLQVARELGWPEIAVVIYDGTGDVDGFALADNRTSELSKWDYRQLTSTLKALQEREQDLNALGWQDYELEPLLTADWRRQQQIAVELDGGKVKDPTIKLTVEQFEVVTRAMDRVRMETQQLDLSDGRCLELLAAEYLSGVNNEEGEDNGAR